MLSDAQAAAIQAIIDNAKSKPAAEVKLKPQTSSSMFGASSGVTRSGGVVEAKTKSDAVAAAALKNASPAEILAAWTAAQTSNGGDPDAAFLEAFKTGRK
jgi:hypothetical protein